MNLHKDDTKAFLEYLGFNVDNHYKFKMRDGEHTASASIDPKNGYIKDFGSGFRGDVIAFYKEIKGCDDREAFLHVEAILNDLKISHNINNSGKKNQFISHPTPINLATKKEPNEIQIEYLSETIVQKYETERKENFARFSELIDKLLPVADNKTKKELALRFQIGYSKDEDRLIMPLRDENGGIVTLWKYNPNLKIKYSFSKDRPRSAFNLSSIKKYIQNLNKPIFIAEGEKDCLNMLSRGYNAVSFGSAVTHIKDKELELFKGAYAVIVFDYDEAGKNGALSLKTQLEKVCNAVEIINWQKILEKQGKSHMLKKGFDFTDYLSEVVSKSIDKEIER